MNRLMPFGFFGEARPRATTSNRNVKPRTEVRVAVKATGLIEASLAVSGPPDRSFRRIDAALVFAITEAGIAEIRSVEGRGGASTENFMQRNILALEYLRLLENSELRLASRTNG
jgi:hypothetical protein